MRLVRTLNALSKASGKRKIPPPKMERTQEINEEFRKFKKTINDPLILQHFDLSNSKILWADTSGFTNSNILHRCDGFRMLRPCNFYSHQCYPAAQNFDTDDKTIYKIVETMKQW